MADQIKVVPNDTPYIEDRGIWRVSVFGSIETNWMPHFSVTLDSGNNLNWNCVTDWVHSVCRKKFDAGTKLLLEIRSNRCCLDKEIEVME